MPVGEKQNLITKIVSEILGENPEQDASFDWFINQHKTEHFIKYFKNIDEIFVSLNGQLDSKSIRKLKPDAYFGGKWNFLFEFDELQHFSTARLKTFDNYPRGLKLNYSIIDWQNFCKANYLKADKYRHNKTTVDFDFVGGRTHQRAYLNCFRNLLPDVQNHKI